MNTTVYPNCALRSAYQLSMDYPKKRSLQQITDEELISLIAVGDKDAFAELYDRFSPQLYGLAMKILRDPAKANDVLQDVFLSLWRNAGTYSLKRGKPLGWMCVICRNRCIDQIRSTKKRQSVFNPLSEQAGDVLADHRNPGPAEKTVASLQRNIVVTAMEKLPESQRKVIDMAYFCGYTQSEISEVLNLPLGTVKSRMRLGLAKLRDELRGKLEPEDLL